MNKSPENIVLPEQYNIQTLLQIIEQKDDRIRSQQIRIEQMQKEITELKKSRDALIVKMNQLMMDFNPDKVKVDSLLQRHTEYGSKLFSKAYSIDHGSPCISHSPLGRQQNISGSAFLQRQKTKKPDEEGILKRSRIFNNAYELSQDLQDKQVEMLERKYGGRLRSRHAALIIQRAFRKYCMAKKFHDLRTAKAEKRLSNRFHTIDLGHREWNNKPLSTMLDISSLDEGSELQTSTQDICFTPKIANILNLVMDKQKHFSKSCTTEVQQISCLREKYPLIITRNIESSESVESSKDCDNLIIHTENQNIPSEYLETIAEQTNLVEQECKNIDFENFALIKETAILEDNSEKHSFSSNVTQAVSSMQQTFENCRSGNRESPLYLNDNIIIVSPKEEDYSQEDRQLEYNEFLLETSDKSCPVINIEDSPVWKRKNRLTPESAKSPDLNRLSNISEDSEGSIEGIGYSSSPTLDQLGSFGTDFHTSVSISKRNDMPFTQVSEIQRKRQYRVGLNLFNKKPEKGVKYLIQKHFIENTPQTVARFLISRKGLSKQMIGEYLGNLQNPFNMAVLEYFVREIDLCGLQVDLALRKFQSFFRLPGEAQKIERLMVAFGHRYCVCNPDTVSKFRSEDTVFILAFAIIMLNTDLHSPNVKPDKRMKLEDFIRNLRNLDDGEDIDREMLTGLYDRIKLTEFKAGIDHVTQVMKVEKNIVGKRPLLALPHRRLVCYCRLFEVHDPNKKERPGIHQREVFLFNDLLVVTKIFSKKKGSVTYNFRHSFMLYGMHVTLFETPNCPHGIHLINKVDNKLMITFNAGNEHDRSKFVEDLKESIYEMDEMENLRIEGELERQQLARNRTAENRDSGLVDMEETLSTDGKEGKLPVDITGLKRSALSNSLLDIHEQTGLSVRRGSAGSLDSGMVSELSTTSSTSQESSPQNNKSKQQQHSFRIGALFTKKGKAKTNLKTDSTEV